MITRLREFWEGTSRTNQVMLAGVLAATLLVGIGFVYWAGTPDYVTLVSNPSPSDSASIIGLLKERKVVYRISPDGTTIEVPAAQRAELRMALAGAGLLNSGSLGYAALDKAPFGQTQVMEQQTIKRALEGEMENSIESLQPVASASVKFAPGDDSLFVSADRRTPSASVLVHLKPGQELTKANVRAIVSMVARAYTGLTTSSVSMVDGDGNLLWDGSHESLATVGMDERQSQERAYKEALAREIQSQIRAVVGPDKSTVIVRAELDFDKRSEKRREVLPGVAVTQQVDEETLKGSGQRGAGGPAGLASNAGGAPLVPSYPGGEVSTTGGAYSRTQTTKTVSAGASETETVKAPGEVKRLAVAVMLDSSVPPAVAAALKQNVETLIGADPSDPASPRQVSIQTVEFDRAGAAAEKKAAETAAAAERNTRLLGLGLPIALMLLMLFILARGLKRMAPQAARLALPGTHTPALAAAGAAGPGATLDLRVGGDEHGSPAPAPGDESEPRVVPLTSGEKVHTFEVITENFDANLESISHLARSKPETVAQLLRTWIKEDAR